MSQKTRASIVFFCREIYSYQPSKHVQHDIFTLCSTLKCTRQRASTTVGTYTQLNLDTYTPYYYLYLYFSC